MNIIHYLIGLPRVRHGGAPVYAFDLLMSQAAMPHNKVSILIQGDTLCWGNKSHIRFSGDCNGLDCYEISNPVVAPLMYGVRKPEYILDGKRYFDQKNLERFYEKTKPDIFHVHTLMGLPIGLLTYLKSKGTKLVLTSHDYYGICPRVNLINRLGNPCETGDGTLCDDCNRYSKNKYWLTFLNSKLFLKYKRKIPIKTSKANSECLSSGNMTDLAVNGESKYIELNSFYKRVFALFDAIHFNSFVSKNVFSQYVTLPYHQVIPITTNAISDRRRRKHFDDTVRISFVGGIGLAKGFPSLKKVLLELYSEGYKNWVLNIWEGGLGGGDADCSNIVYRGRYSPSQLKKVYDETDLLLVPSIWKETFSLVALEALSFGVPVLMSDNVGAQILIQDIVPDFIYHGEDGLRHSLRRIFSDSSLLVEYNTKILESRNINFSQHKHAEDMMEFYQKVVSL